MIDKDFSILLTRLIAPCYVAEFLADPVDVAKAQLAALGFDFVDVLYGTDFKGIFGQETVPYGLIARDPKNRNVYAAIRGTDDPKEWAEDGWAVPEPWPFSADPKIRTHAGFTGLYQTLSLTDGTPILPALKALAAIGPAYVTGHSLGAALANLLAAALGKDCFTCVTFEGPRVGNAEFVAWMDARVPDFFRYVIIGDAVPHLPPEINGYSHAGTELDLSPDGIIPLTLDPIKYLSNHHVLSSVQQILTAA